MRMNKGFSNFSDSKIKGIKDKKRNNVYENLIFFALPPSPTPVSLFQ